MEISDQKMAMIITLVKLLDSSSNRPEILRVSDQLAIEIHYIKSSGQILQYLGHITVALNKIRKLEAAFLLSVAYNIENIQMELNKKLP